MSVGSSCFRKRRDKTMGGRARLLNVLSILELRV